MFPWPRSRWKQIALAFLPSLTLSISLRAWIDSAELGVIDDFVLTTLALFVVLTAFAGLYYLQRRATKR
jgi:hypothetical protein